MGASESTEIQVNFDRSSLFYFTGEQVTGIISFKNTHERLVLDNIFLEFIGELGYATQETRQYYENFANSQPERYTEQHRIPFMNSRLSVVQPPSGQRELILNHGDYSWPFEFTIPKHLPPSLHSSIISHPYVKYYTRIVLDKPWYKPNVKQIYPLTIFPRVNLRHVACSQQPVYFSYSNRKQVQLTGYLLQGAIVPNQKLSIRINLQNPKQCIIKNIEAILIQHHQVDQSHHREVIFRVNLPDICGFNQTELQRTFNLLVLSTQLAPSYKFMAHCDHQVHPVVTTYELELKVASQGMLTDFGVKIPLIIGTESGLDPQQQHKVNNSVEMSTSSVQVPVSDKVSPSYDFIE